VAAVSNNTGTHPGPLALKIAAWVIGQPFVEPTPVELSAEALARFLGVYRGRDMGEWKIALEDGRLTAQPEHGPQIKLVPFSANQFSLEHNLLDQLTFASDADGVITSFEFRGMIGTPQVAMKM
jgi:hypothetical protein